MGTDDSKSRARIRLRLGFELALRQGRCHSLSPIFFVFVFACGFLHGDDVYFSLEDFGFGLADGAQAQAQRKDSHSKVRFLGCFDLLREFSVTFSWIPVFSAIDRWSFVVFQIAAHSLLFVEMWICHEK
ncbi:hypothetical protein Syun_003351 [Stephania yunnanensis]|uniref:Uncharacterized protein n=1 Tax=Stephania yunnanensis TaxID=152371 RepID=A0AAP0L4V4_9MAGN